MIQVIPKSVTLEEFLELPVGDGVRELEDGVVIELSQVQRLHGRITKNCCNVFEAHITNRGFDYSVEAQVYGFPIPRSVRKNTSRTPDVCVVTEEEGLKYDRRNNLYIHNF